MTWNVVEIGVGEDHWQSILQLICWYDGDGDSDSDSNSDSDGDRGGVSDDSVYGRYDGLVCDFVLWGVVGKEGDSIWGDVSGRESNDWGCGVGVAALYGNVRDMTLCDEVGGADGTVVGAADGGEDGVWGCGGMLVWG